MSTAMLLRLAPFLYVLVGSTSWIVTKYVTPFADPLTFLSLRYELAALFMALIAFTARSPQPKNLAQLVHMLGSGILMHVVYVGGSWWAVSKGMPLSICVAIFAAQPLLSAALSKPIMGERVGVLQWLGILIGFAGIFMVTRSELAALTADMWSAERLPILVLLVGVCAFTAASFYQKKALGDADIRTLITYQYIGAFVVMFPLAWCLEPMYFELQFETTFGLLWSVLGISLFTIALFIFMTRHHAVARITALHYLLPPLVAIQAYAFFGESLTQMQLVGMAVVALGVWLATRKARSYIPDQETGRG